MADMVELSPEVGEGFADLFGVFNFQFGKEECEDAERHGNAVVFVGVDGGTGRELRREKTYLCGGLGDGGSHLF